MLTAIIWILVTNRISMHLMCYLYKFPSNQIKPWSKMNRMWWRKWFSHTIYGHYQIENWKFQFYDYLQEKISRSNWKMLVSIKSNRESKEKQKSIIVCSELQLKIENRPSFRRKRVFSSKKTCCNCKADFKVARKFETHSFKRFLYVSFYQYNSGKHGLDFGTKNINAFEERIKNIEINRKLNTVKWWVERSE